MPAEIWASRPGITATQGGEPMPLYFVGHAEFVCPRWHRPRARTAPGLWQDFAREIKASDLPPEILQSLIDALPNLRDDITPEALKQQFPEARPLIEVAVKLDSGRWLALLGVLLTTIAAAIGWMTLTATEDAARTAHFDAQEALHVAREAKPKQTLKLSDQDTAKIIATAEADLRARAKEQRRKATPNGPR